MASLGGSDGGQTLVPLVCAFFRLPRGCPTPMEVLASFQPALGDSETSAMVEVMQRHRRSIEQLSGVEKGKKYLEVNHEVNCAPASEILRTMESYIPCVQQLTASVNANQDVATLGKALVVEWPSPLSMSSTRVKLNLNARGVHIHSALIFESAMLLVHRAHLLYEDAWDFVNDSRMDPVIAAERLKEAAGTLQYLQNQLAESWKSSLDQILNSESFPFELHVKVSKAISEMFLAQAQQMAIAKALMSGKANPALLSKLCVGVSELMEQAAACIASNYPDVELTAVIGDKKKGPVTSFWRFQSVLFLGLAHRFTAQAAWKQDDYGRAIYHQRKAVELIKPAKKGAKDAGGMPPLEGQLERLKPHLDTFREEIAGELRSYEADNTTIYYFAVPETGDPCLSLSKIIMMKPTAYTPETMEPLPLVGKQMSDEQLARQLQEELSTGADEGPPPNYGASDDPPPPAYEPPPAVTPQSMDSQARLIEMGFSSDAVIAALAKHGNNEQAALNDLLS